MQVILSDPERANLAAIFLHRVLSRSTATPPAGAFQVKAGGMSARIVFDPAPAVESGEGPACCVIEGSFATLLRVALRGGAVGAWLRGRVRMRGNPFKALALLKVIRCRN